MGQITNREFASKDEAFKKACQKAGVTPTKRQASKWNNGKGLAWKSRAL